MQATESAGNGASTLALKPVGGVNRSPKQRVPVDPQNGDIATAKEFLKKKTKQQKPIISFQAAESKPKCVPYFLFKLFSVL